MRCLAFKGSTNVLKVQKGLQQVVINCPSPKAQEMSKFQVVRKFWISCSGRALGLLKTNQKVFSSSCEREIQSLNASLSSKLFVMASYCGTPKARDTSDRECETPTDTSKQLELKPWNEANLHTLSKSTLRTCTPSKTPWSLSGTPKVVSDELIYLY